ncbi:MAG TPA: hypothetical protein DIC64_04355 [Alphaproteobacteria bacterium]|nr:hypothetical protein [Alphaproteobacteria bacterium]
MNMNPHIVAGVTLVSAVCIVMAVAITRQTIRRIRENGWNKENLSHFIMNLMAVGGLLYVGIGMPIDFFC